MMKVNEIFWSIQGEGTFTGTPAVFVRFSGCSCGCSFCDTDFSQFKEMAPLDISYEIYSKHPRTSIVVLTGGEPTEQNKGELETLIQHLHVMGRSVHLETNGAHDVPSGIDWVTCSPKPNLRYRWIPAQEYKFVVTKDFDFEVLKPFQDSKGNTLIWLQPDCNDPRTTSKLIMDFLTTKNTHQGTKHGMQIHKFYGMR